MLIRGIENRCYTSCSRLPQHLPAYGNPASRNVLIRVRPKPVTVNKMTHARLVDVKFKPGKRDEGMSIIADVAKNVREGFEGMLVLLPDDDPNKATYVTLWDSEESMNDSWKKINPKATEALKNVLAEPTVMRTNEVREVEKITLPA